MTKVTKRLAFAIFAACIGAAVQHGYNTGVISQPERHIKLWLGGCVKDMDKGEEFCSQVKAHLRNKTEARKAVDEKLYVCQNKECEEITLLFSVIASAFPFGGMIGGVLVLPSSNRLGRRNSLIYSNSLVIIAATLMGLSKTAGSWPMLAIGRLLIGVVCGLVAGLAPMYLNEVSPKNKRGAIGTVYQLVLTMSILASQCFGLWLDSDTLTSWHILFAITVIPGLIQVVLMPFTPQSPKHLYLKGNHEKAEDALIWLRGYNQLDAVGDELAQYQKESRVERLTAKTLFTEKRLRQPLFSAVVMMLTQQLTGINAVIYFSTTIFESAGLNEHNARLATVGVGTINVIATIFAVYFVEHIGRKKLMIGGLLGMMLSSGVLFGSLIMEEQVRGFEAASVMAVYAFIIFFAIGPGPIPWFFTTEVFNTQARPVATAITVTVNWFANFVVGLSFEPLENTIGPYVFVLFGIFQFMSVVYIHFLVPETKDKTVDEILEYYAKKNKKQPETVDAEKNERQDDNNGEEVEEPADNNEQEGGPQTPQTSEQTRPE